MEEATYWDYEPFDKDLWIPMQGGSFAVDAADWSPPKKSVLQKIVTFLFGEKKC